MVINIICTTLRGKFKRTASAIICILHCCRPQRVHYNLYRTGCGFVDRNECIISYNAPTAVQYTDIALAAVLCSIAQVLVAKTTTTPHLIGGKTLHRSLEFFYSLTCRGRLWAISSPIRIMFTSSQWRSEKPTRVATTLVYIYINVLIHLTSLVPS